MKKKNINYDELLESWLAPFVARCKIEEFTQGLYKPRSMTTLDSAKRGISPRYRIGRCVFYKAEDVISWLENKARKGDLYV